MLTVDPQNNIVVDRGDGESINFSVVNSAGAAQSVATWAFAFTVKRDIDDVIGSAKFQKTSGGGGITIEPGSVTGLVVVQLADIDTEALSGDYVYDLQGDDGTYTHTVAKGRFRVSKDVTTPGSAGTPSPILFFLNGVIYLLDQTTGLYGAFRLNNGNWEQSATQSATIPFTF